MKFMLTNHTYRKFSTGSALGRFLILGGFFLLGTTSHRAQDLKLIGSFQDVRSSDGEHCAGHSLKLWRYGNRVLGLLDIHEDLCGDPPCSVIQDASLNTKTGRLRFWASPEERWSFVGTLKRDVVSGTLNGKRVRLTRNQNEIRADSDRNLAAWCSFWSSVSRCKGVREMCSLPTKHTE
jgi:hypothetical protein